MTRATGMPKLRAGQIEAKGLDIKLRQAVDDQPQQRGRVGRGDVQMARGFRLAAAAAGIDRRSASSRAAGEYGPSH